LVTDLAFGFTNFFARHCQALSVRVVAVGYEHISGTLVKACSQSQQIVCDNALVALYEVRLQVSPECQGCVLVELFPRFGRTANFCAVCVNLCNVLINACQYFNDNIVAIYKCVMCHYAQLTFPEPAVMVAIVFKPLVVVEPVKPAPMVIVPAVVGNDNMITPLPPAAPFDELWPPPPPPPPVFTRRQHKTYPNSNS
jgi:hypothetical protein